ncbi:hypothetical protein [Streptomyces sp. NPDC059862]|uniref:hypothetical protein n=1 Tax=unclassified Streptomyces TaxID=2593676 RepID=UPI00362DA283
MPSGAEDDDAEFLGQCHEPLRIQLGLRRGQVKWGVGPDDELGESGRRGVGLLAGAGVPVAWGR